MGPHVHVRSHQNSPLESGGTNSGVLQHLLLAIQLLGPDVNVKDSRSHTVLRRNQVFGAYRTTSRRVDLGLYLPGQLVGDRLADGRNFRLNRVTHHISLLRPEDLDDQVLGWLRQAYERS